MIKKIALSIEEIISFLVSPFLCLLYSINNIIKNKKGGVPYFFVSLFLAYIAFLTVPSPVFDLYRHYKIVNIFINKSFPFYDIQNIYDWGYTFTIAHSYYAYLIAQTGIPHLYSLFTVLLVYISIFYIFIKSDGYNKLYGTTKLFIVLILITCSFYRLFIFTIRNVFVFVISFILLKLLFEERRINWLFFIFATIFLVFFHPACLIVYLLYFISIIKIGNIFKCFIAGVLLFYKYIFELLYQVISNKQFFITHKLHYYLTKPNFVNVNYWILYTSIFVISVFLLVYYYLNTKRVYIFDIYCMCLILSTVFNFDLYRRFIVLIVLIIPKYLIYLFNTDNKKLKAFISICFFGIIGVALIGDIAGINTYGWVIENNAMGLFFNAFLGGLL